MSEPKNQIEEWKRKAVKIEPWKHEVAKKVIKQCENLYQKEKIN